MRYSKVTFKLSLFCHTLSIQSIWRFKRTLKVIFKILAVARTPPQKCWGNVSALFRVVLCSLAGALSHALTETIWAVQPQPQPQLAPGSLPAKTLSHLSTEDQRTLQCLQPHSCCTCQTSFFAPLPLLSAHVFPRLTTNPPFMCILGPLELTGVTALETVGHVVACLALLSPGLFNFFSLCLCVCLFVCLKCWKPHSEKSSMRRRLLRSHSAKP